MKKPRSVRNRIRRAEPRRKFTEAEKIAIAEDHINAVYDLFEKSPEPQSIPVLQADRRSSKTDRRKK